MRPAELFPLFTDVANLKGVGPAVRKSLNRLLGYASPFMEQDATGKAPVVRDLLFHLPTGVVDRRKVFTIAEAPLDGVATLIVTVDKHMPGPPGRRAGRRPPYRIHCHDESGDMQLVFFNARGDYLTKQFPEGQKRAISGRCERFDGSVQMTHPDIAVPVEQLEQVARLEPTYPLTYGISNKMLLKLMAQGLAKVQPLPEWLEDGVRQQKGWPAWHEALRSLHAPESLDAFAENSPVLQRLAYDEILSNQLALALIRTEERKEAGVTIEANDHLRDATIAQLPFTLTKGQQDVLAEVDADMASGNRMLRLLQGDVGSGKTLVCLLAMLRVVAAGKQCALMAPTELLARQHAASIARMLEGVNASSALLTGKMPKKERDAVMARAQAGEVDILIGTHALFQQDVAFKDLALIVIDEQHRFGVNQRLALASKGDRPHLLLMTATPIPRTLTMTAYGDMDTSQLTEKPANRLPIDTRTVNRDRIDEVVQGLQRALSQGAKAYWICPLIEESEETDTFSATGDLAAAEERHRVLQRILGERVGLVHGRMKPAEREEVMQGFAGDHYDLLVATTVIEVGVDVPDATIIVIEQAERFGLAQLHQLRGRVGRGDKQSSCLLLYSSKCSDIAKERLRVIRETNDGFRIAEEDLLLRGAGDVLGTRQSGLPQFRFVDFAVHRELILMARDDVKLLLHRDAQLQGARGKAVRLLLALFGYDRAVDYLQAG